MSALVFPQESPALTLAEVLENVPAVLARKLAPSYGVVEPMGFRAHNDGAPITANPFGAHERLQRVWWHMGWRRGQRWAGQVAFHRERECALDGAMTSAPAAAGVHGKNSPAAADSFSGEF